MPYAHSREEAAETDWQPLGEHLRSVAELTRRSADVWGAGALGYLAGLWHDLGKYAPDWQEFLHATSGADSEVDGDDRVNVSRGRRGPDHSTAGAIHALRLFGEHGPTAFPGLVLRFAIAAHHAGLSDRQELATRLRRPEKLARYASAATDSPAEVLEPGVVPSLPEFLRIRASTPAEKAHAMRALEGLVRMVYSALVDADFLDTERFLASGGPRGSCPTHRGAWKPLAEYGQALDAYLQALTARPQTQVNHARQRVLAWCQQAAEGGRGAYSLTVPTGGGKTLSSLAFALRHADVHRLRRVVVVLPFLSILDQTADVYRGVFERSLGSPCLVEHHSSVEPVHDTPANRLASENWDAPLIVTTQVQLFESLFSNRSSACRKLHNLANSVVILDEVQTLPVELLTPILDQLQGLCRNYGVSLLLTTATQPGLHLRELGSRKFHGIDPKPTEIIPEQQIDALFGESRRTQVEWPRDDEPTAWDQLASRLVAEPQVLAIVHRRQDAQDLWRSCEGLAPGEQIHLSALMCAAHRREVLSRIREDLRAGQRCRVVSTQLVEAGVDVDFPVVFRAMAGLESLAQSAGRCNREGRLPGLGRFVVFLPSTEPPSLLRHHRDIARVMLAADPELELARPETFRQYFDMLYATRDRDVRGIQACRQELRFEEVSNRFRMMDEAGDTVFVPFREEGRRAIENVRHEGLSSPGLRRLQPFGVAVYPKAMEKLRSTGAIELLHDSVWVLVSDAHYDADLGLAVDPEPGTGLIV